jgi:hypothetical protein
LPFYFIMLRVTLGPIALCKIEWTESTKSRYRLTSLPQSFWRSSSCRRLSADTSPQCLRYPRSWSCP